MIWKQNERLKQQSVKLECSVEWHSQSDICFKRFTLKTVPTLTFSMDNPSSRSDCVMKSFGTLCVDTSSRNQGTNSALLELFLLNTKVNTETSYSNTFRNTRRYRKHDIINAFSYFRCLWIALVIEDSASREGSLLRTGKWNRKRKRRVASTFYWLSP